MPREKRILWNLVGAFLFCISLIKVFDIFNVGHDRSFQAMEGFYREKKNSLDAVYIGGSNVHAFWEPPIGWNDGGIAVWSLSMDSMPGNAIKYLISEARKTQPNALYIININAFKRPAMDVNYVMIHRVVDYMRFSPEKIKQINSLSDWAGIPLLVRLEFLFPIIRFHSRWAELNTWDFTHTVDGLKKGIVYSPYLNRIENLSGKYKVTDKAIDATAAQLEVLTDLLDYCDQEKVNALFLLVPQAISYTAYEQINSLGSVITQRGYPYWDILRIADDLGIQTDTDFYNAAHTNVHGSMKFIDYLGKKLVDEYGFTDKRGMEGWESWDKSVELYTAVIGPYTLPIERNHEKRDYELSAPIMDKPLAEGSQITLNWTPSVAAEFYEIFRKSTEPGKENWESYDTIDGNMSSYVDNGLASGVNYTYAVVPGYTEGGVKYYGKFDYSGVTGKIR